MGILTPVYLSLTVFVLGLILLYMFRKQYDEKVISANFLWNDAMNEWQAMKWWKRIQSQLLLFLQILILLFLIVALIRPYISSTQIGGDEMIILIDHSSTMSSLFSEETTRLEQAKDEALHLINKRQSDQRISLVLMGEKPEVLLTSETNKDIITKTLNHIEQQYDTPNYESAISLANAIGKTDNKTIHVFSDRVTEQDIGHLAMDVPIEVTNIGSETDTNVSILTFGVQDSNAIVTIENESEHQQQRVFVTLKAETQKVETKEVVIDAANKVIIPFHGIPNASYYEVSLDVEDSYELDNTAYVFSTNQEQATIYAIGDINPFVIKAFNQLGHTLIQAKEINEMNEFAPNSIIVVNELNEYLPNLPIFLLQTDNVSFTPLTEKLSWKTNDDLMQFVEMDTVYIQQAGQVNERLNLETIISSGNIPLVEKGQYNGQSIIRLGFRLQDSDWPLHTSFPIFMYHSIQFLQEQTTNLGYFLPNEKRELNLSEDTVYRFYHFDSKQTDSFVVENGIFEAPAKPGLYRLKNNEHDHYYFVVTLAPKDKTVLPAPSFQLVGGEKEQQSLTMKIELWHWFVFLALMVLLLEWEVYRRGNRI